MLWHYRKRAEECASRIVTSRSETVRQNYERLLESWKALIAAEEARLSRAASGPQPGGRILRGERPRLEIVRAPLGADPIVDRPIA